MNTESIRPLQVILIVMTVIGLKSHVTIIPPLLEHVGRDGWASVLLAGLVFIPWTLMLVYVFKKMAGQDSHDWLEARVGKFVSRAIHYVLAIYVLFLAASTFTETMMWINTTFLPETPTYPILIVFTVLCVLLATTNIRTIAITNAILLFSVIVFGFFVAFTNLKVKNFALLQPMFTDGFKPILLGVVYPASGLVELVLLFFIGHQIKGRMRFIHFTIIIGILTMLTLGPIIGSITEFGPDEASKQTYPAYEEWGLVTLGQFIDNLSFLSIYQWLTGAFIRIGFFLYIAIQLLRCNDWKRIKHVWLIIAPVFLALSISLLMVQDRVFNRVKGEYFLPLTVVVFLIVLLLFVVLAMFKGKSNKEVNE